MATVKKFAQQSRAAVIAVTETWLDCSILYNEINIADYVVIRRDRQRDGGGVCLYIRSDLAFNPRSNISHPDVEMIWAELLLPHSRPILIGPPTANNLYSLFENSCLDKERFLDLETIVLGDFNTDVLRPSTTLYKSLNHLMYLCNWSQLINEPTRVTLVTESALDLVIVSDKEIITQSGVIHCGLSDHFLTYCTRKASKNKFNAHNTMQKGSLKNYSPEKFIQELGKLD